MDGPRFDAWTRRRFGLAAGGALAALIGSHEADAKKNNKKKRKKKRCKKLQASCKPGSKRKCCGDLKCRVNSLDSGVQTFCCKTEGKSCETVFDCCDPFSCIGIPPTCTLVTSDRNLKTNFGSIDPADMLARVQALPIATWNYLADDPAVRHIGPMAQDFAAAFGVGADDRHIHPIDGQGVAFAAIQGLTAEIGRMRLENEHLAARIGALEVTRD